MRLCSLTRKQKQTQAQMMLTGVRSKGSGAPSALLKQHLNTRGDEEPIRCHCWQVEPAASRAAGSTGSDLSSGLAASHALLEYPRQGVLKAGCRCLVNETTASPVHIKTVTQSSSWLWRYQMLHASHALAIKQTSTNYLERLKRGGKKKKRFYCTSRQYLK